MIINNNFRKGNGSPFTPCLNSTRMRELLYSYTFLHHIRKICANLHLILLIAKQLFKKFR